MFIECHLVYEEDYGWFDGANLVKQKVPVMVQEKVRTFRRKLAVASEAKSSRHTPGRRAVCRFGRTPQPCGKDNMSGGRHTACACYSPADALNRPNSRMVGQSRASRIVRRTFDAVTTGNFNSRL